MKTNMKELNLNELEQAIGGGAVHRAAKRKLKKLIFGWLSDLFSDNDQEIQGPIISRDGSNSYVPAGQPE